jgi:hypothetical protein
MGIQLSGTAGAGPALLSALGVAFLIGCGSDGTAPPATPSPTTAATQAPPTATATLALPSPTGTPALPTATGTPVRPTATLAAPTSTHTPAALCAERRGGALVSFAVCDESLTVWSSAPAFIDQALALLESGGQLIPVFEILRDGSDCDGQWTWHVDPAAMSFAELAIELCDGCPSHIEDDKPYWLGTVGQYCPWTARVVAVDDRRGSP